MIQPSTLNTVFDKKIRGHLPVGRFCVSTKGVVRLAVPDAYKPRLYRVMEITRAGQSQEITSFSLEKPTYTDLSRDGQVFLGATDDNLYIIHGTEKNRVFPGIRENYLGVSLDADGARYAAASADLLSSMYTLRYVQKSGAAIWTRNLPSAVSSIRLSPEGLRIIVGCDDGRVTMYDDYREVVWELEGQDSIESVTTTESGNLSVMLTASGTVRAVGKDGCRLWEVMDEDEGIDCAVSADGRLIAVVRKSANDSSRLDIYSSGGSLIVDRDSIPSAKTVALSDDGRYVAISCEDGTLQVLELAISDDAAAELAHEHGLFDQACALYDQGDRLGALKKLAQALNTAPCSTEMCRKLLEIRDELLESMPDDAGEAVAQLSQMSEICLWDSEILTRLLSERGRLFTRLMESAETAADIIEIETAVSGLRELLKGDYTNLPAIEALGKAEDRLVAEYLAAARGATDAAQMVQILEKAFAKRPSSEIQEELCKARMKLSMDAGMSAYQAGEYGKAASEFRRVLSIDSENTEAAKYLQYSEQAYTNGDLQDRFSKLE